MNNKNINQMASCFLNNIGLTFKGNEELCDTDICKLDICSEDATDMFTALLLACRVLYEKLTGDDGDLLDFISILNKLAVRYISNGEIGK